MGADGLAMLSSVRDEQGCAYDPSHLEASVAQRSDVSGGSGVSDQKYIFGSEDRGIGDVVMELYCSRAEYKENMGRMGHDPRLPHVDKARYLITHPMWGDALTQVRGSGATIRARSA